MNTRDLHLGYAHNIDGFILEEMERVMDDDANLLAFQHDQGRTYLLTESCVVDVTTATLTLAPRTGTGGVANVWWGPRKKFDGKKMMEIYRRWETQERMAVLTYTGRLYELSRDGHAVICEADILNDAGEKQYVLLDRRYLWLFVRDLDELQYCTVELLPTYQVRIGMGEHVLGMVMPLSKLGRVLSTDADLSEEEAETPDQFYAVEG